MKNIAQLGCLLLLLVGVSQAFPQSQQDIDEAIQEYEEAKSASENYLRSPGFTNGVKTSALQGDDMSQWSLGTQYEQGKGVPQSYVRAYMWYSVAAAQGGDISDLAIAARDAVAAKLTLNDLSIAQNLAIKCFESHYKDCE